MTFGERMSIARKEKKLAQKALAELLGVSPMRISHYESGNRAASTPTNFTSWH